MTRLYTQEPLTVSDELQDDDQFLLVRTVGELGMAKLVATCFVQKRGSFYRQPPLHEAEANAVLFAFAPLIHDCLEELVLLTHRPYVASLSQEDYNRRWKAAWKRAFELTKGVTANEQAHARASANQTAGR